jgi:hypothetical protein
MALLVTSVNTANGQLLVRDTVTGTVSWKPGTADQIAAASNAINTGGTYNQDYIWPSDAEQPPSLTKPPAQYPGGGNDTLQTPQQYPGNADDIIQTPKYTPAQMQQIFNDNNVKLDTGEYVSLVQYNKLTMNQQTNLKAGGVAKFNEQRAPVKTVARTDPAMAEQTFLIAKELNIPPEILMVGATIVIPVGVASPEPVSKLTAVIILAGLITAYGAVRAYRYFEESQSQAAQEAAATARKFEENTGRPLAPSDIIVATTDGALFSLEEGTIKTDTSHDKSQYEVKHSTAETKDQFVVTTSTAAKKDQTIIKTSTAAPRDQTLIKTDTFDPTDKKYVFKNITAVVMAGAPRRVTTAVMERAIDYNKVVAGLIDDFNARQGITGHRQAGERVFSGTRFSSDFQKYLDTTAANEAAATRSHSARSDYLIKRAALLAAWHTYVQSANPTPISGNPSAELLQAAALYQLNQYINGRQLSPATKQALKAEIQQAAEGQSQGATQTQTQAQTQTATDTQTHSATKEANRTTTRAAARTAARTAEATTAGTLAAEGELPEPELKDEKPDNVFTEADGAVAWKQGIGWWVFTSPYNRPQDRRFLLKKPVGATITADAKSAIGTIQAIGGKAPINTKFDMGIVDVKITSAPRTPSRDSGRAAIKFTRDAEHSYGGQGTRSKRVGPYHYKDGKVSRNPIE